MLLYLSLGNRGREEEMQNRESARLDIKDKHSFFFFFQFCLILLMDMVHHTPWCTPQMPKLVPA